MSRSIRRGCLVVFATFWLVAPAQAMQVNPCQGFTQITTPAQLDNVRNNLSGKFCLENDLDMSGIANFAPLGTFSGQFDGRGHVIRNLTITSSADKVGLFSGISGSVSNLGLINAKVTGNGVGGGLGLLTGQLYGSVTKSYSTGLAKIAAGNYQTGGLAGYTSPGSKITYSWSSATVASLNQYAAGGLVGQHDGQINGSFATGPVSCGGTVCQAGGLVGANATDGNPANGLIKQSFATGAISCDHCYAGGLAGTSNGKIQDSYASGPVSAPVGSNAGGLVGANSGNVLNSYSVGPVGAPGPGFQSGGLIGRALMGSTVTSSYWDQNTSGQSFSDGGLAQSTVQLQTLLPIGFANPPWSISKNFSYPYFNLPAVTFASPLATTVKSNKLYVFLPLAQLEDSEYAAAPAHANHASQAAVYAMIARAIGITDNVTKLKGVKLDTYYWDDATQTVSWKGPVKNYATIDPLQTVSANAKLNTNNVVGQLKNRQVVMVRGSYGNAKTHWMLATLFVTDGANKITHVIANDPYTGGQVQIDVNTKQVTKPINYPLTGWTLDAFQAVTLN